MTANIIRVRNGYNSSVYFNGSVYLKSHVFRLDRMVENIGVPEHTSR